MTPLRRHAPFLAGIATGLVALPIALRFAPSIAIELAADLFFLVYLGLTARKIRLLTPEFLRRHATSADEPVWVIFLVTAATVAVVVGSLFVVINSAGNPGWPKLVLALASVGLGWFTIHTMAALHYAHLFWRPAKAGKDGRTHGGGLDFPQCGEPGGYEFLYFAFVIGMTAQTSDVAVTTTRMRRISLVHSVVSFFFNTVLVAAAVNLAVSLGS